jgi:hypothetical protein
VAAIIAALVLSRWTGAKRPAVPAPDALPARRATDVRNAARPALHTPPNPAPRVGAEGPSPGATPRLPAAKPTPAVFDLATITPAENSRADEAEERFRTNEWFTKEDLRHPELFFQLAEQMPELNRPEERLETLEYFLAYREQLERELEASPENSDERQEILATIGRYDDAIERLRALLDAEETN